MKTQILSNDQIRAFLEEQHKTGKTIKQLATELNVSYAKVYNEIRAYKDNELLNDIMSVEIHADQAKAMAALGHRIHEDRQSKINVIRRIVIRYPDIKDVDAKRIASRVCSRLGINRISKVPGTFGMMFSTAKKEVQMGIIQGA
mgnify:CR=1 FL=1